MKTNTPKTWNKEAWCERTKTYNHKKTIDPSQRRQAQRKRFDLPIVEIIRRRIRSEAAYTQRRETQLPWSIIAKNVGYDDAETARRAAKRHSQKYNLLWPIEPTITKGESAYRLSAEGLRWPDVEQVMNFPGYIYTGRALQYAKEFAKRKGKPWPPKKSR